MVGGWQTPMDRASGKEKTLADGKVGGEGSVMGLKEGIKREISSLDEARYAQKITPEDVGLELLKERGRRRARTTRKRGETHNTPEGGWKKKDSMRACAFFLRRRKSLLLEPRREKEKA